MSMAMKHSATAAPRVISSATSASILTRDFHIINFKSSTLFLLWCYGSNQLFNFPPIFFQEYQRFPYYNLFLQWIYIYRWFYSLHRLHLHLHFLESISEFDISLYKPVFDMAESSSSFRAPWFLRLMNVADELILSIPDDDACKLWGVDKGPTNVMIHTEDGRLFNVFLSPGKGKLFLFHGWSNVVEHLRLTNGCLVVFNLVSSTTFKLTSYVDRVSRGSFWTYLLPPSSNFYVIPESILPKVYDYSSNDVISTVMIDNKIFKVAIETSNGKVGFTVGFDVIVSLLQLKADCILLFTKGFVHFFYLKVFGKNGVEMNFPDVDVDQAEAAPIDTENEADDQIGGSVRRFSRMAGERYFRIPDPVSRMARLHEGLRDITVKLMHFDPPKQFTNGTRRKKKNRRRLAIRVNQLQEVHESC
ncbi:putative transcription factor B3-Domain family [Helianthus annuus]|nr:putative transcription factor B3-Domain family [Helianthus annuus]KAJ0640080.1 putative transcription factor B3-Domain family [Helianthus annuus]KAJ0644038.1 putative transcription factor B3-Domain family [Helianthus annuus]KAJ0954185.1 putative transcription factor B3-Domain family [Helianthus annuus]